MTTDVISSSTLKLCKIFKATLPKEKYEILNTLAIAMSGLGPSGKLRPNKKTFVAAYRMLLTVDEEYEVRKVLLTWQKEIRLAEAKKRITEAKKTVVYVNPVSGSKIYRLF